MPIFTPVHRTVKLPDPVVTIARPAVTVHVP
jgi:hypothetical protein